jgi:hypothetical protein
MTMVVFYHLCILELGFRSGHCEVQWYIFMTVVVFYHLCILELGFRSGHCEVQCINVVGENLI